MADSLYQVMQDALREMLGNLHTATVARVVQVNETTVDVQPVINRVVDGESVKLPVFVEVPPVTLQGAARIWPCRLPRAITAFWCSLSAALTAGTRVKTSSHRQRCGCTTTATDSPLWE